MSSRAVEIGLLLHTRHLMREGEDSSLLNELWETASCAEKIGFDHLWLGDSPRLSLLDRAHADCITMMAALAAKTSTIKIGIVPLIMALRNPVLLAHSLATLDVIAGGRTIIGVSAGPQYQYAEREFAACGVPYTERAGRLDESIQLIRRLWSESPFAFAGKHFQFGELGIEPKPIQKPIPIWIAAGDNDNALLRVARLGDGWFTVARTAGQFVARRQKIDRYAKEYDRAGLVTPSALFATFHLHTNEGNAQEEGWNLAERYFSQPRSKLGHLSPFFGTPEECAEKLQPYINAGLTAIVARFVAQDAQAQMGLFIEELRPRLALRSG
jgi:alkanesulfonate monooxygenase SsuD/methylene tetrahydromethanopterin reductase-like flavin-dependent oxidoreductase (luciferase family)